MNAMTTQQASQDLDNLIKQVITDVQSCFNLLRRIFSMAGNNISTIKSC
jgi:hypothetical protein